MWKAILSAINFLSGGTFDKIASAVVNIINKRTDAQIAKIGAEKEVVIASIQAGVSLGEQFRQIYVAQWGWWGTRYLMMAAAIPPIIHSGAVYLDSTFKFGWAIARAPGVYEGQELKIIAAVCGFQVAQTAVGGLVQWLTKK